MAKLHLTVRVDRMQRLFLQERFLEEKQEDPDLTFSEFLRNKLPAPVNSMEEVKKKC